jgi:choline dehydrogenase
VDAAVACGYPFNEDYNAATQEGVGYAQLSQRGRWRCSAADAFLKPLLGRKEGLKLQLHARAQRIELANGYAVAVSYVNGGKHHRAEARNIVLCAGAIDSPVLLLRSGIGDPRELRRHHIDVTVDLPGVGCNLREHPLLRLTYRTQIPTNNPTEGFAQKLGIAGKFIMSGEGPISNLFEAAAFFRTSRLESSPGIQLHFMTVGQVMKPDGTFALAPYPSVTVLLNKSHPVSSGCIRLASADPNDAPLIECRLFEDEADVDTMVEGVAVVRKIMASPPLGGVVAEEVMPGAHVAGVQESRDYVRRRSGIAFHPAGTCRMGTTPDAVVGPDLRVRGTQNLWVADASIMPDLISGNTNAVCMMIGAKLGKQFVSR